MHSAPHLPSTIRLLLRVPVPWVFVLTYLAGVGLERARGSGARGTGPPAIGVAGAVVFLIGAAIAVWGLLAFRRARTTTTPGEASSQLVTWGPYRFTRNPMYLGLTMAYVGEAGILHQLAPLLLLPLVVAYVDWVVIPLEESTLTRVFGARYEEYRAGVRRWL
jgi:protein-S-isoprenylcysteine O-methyltransferase Ste14